MKRSAISMLVRKIKLVNETHLGETGAIFDLRGEIYHFKWNRLRKGVRANRLH